MSPHASFPVRFFRMDDVLEGIRYENGVGFARKGLVRGDGAWRNRDDGKAHQLWFVCPCGCHTIQAVSVFAGDRGWQWNGDLDKPTLTPSIQLIDGCDWHGFLKDGWWTL